MYGCFLCVQVSKLGSNEPWLVLDGAHTPDSAAALVHTLKQAFPDMPVGFIVAMADDKDHAGDNLYPPWRKRADEVIAKGR